MVYKTSAKRRAYQALWRAAHREEIHVYDVAWRAAHPGALRIHRKTHRAAHPEKCEQHRKAEALRRAAYPEQYRAAMRKWSKANPEKRRAQQKKRQALKRGAAISDFTAAQWRDMQARYDHRCAYCGKRAKGHLTQDHITPLAKGGNHTLSNIVPACGPCNRKKGVKGPLIPVQPLLLV